MHKGPRGTEAVESGHVVTVGTLRAHHPGTAGTQSDTDHIVAVDAAHAFKVRGGCEGGGKGYLGSDEVAFTISTHQDQHIFSEGAAFPINTQLGLRGPDVSNTSREGLGLGGENDPAYTLQAGHSHAVAYATQERAVCENPDAGPDGTGVRADDAAYTLEARGTPQAVAYAIQDVRGLDKKQNGKGWSDEGVSYTVDTHATQGVARTEPPIGFDAYNNDVTGDVTKTIDTGQDYHHVPNVLQSTVRRLTPVECERLQGFPDNFTAIPWRKKGAEDCPDGPRYKALGNSMAVPVMRWIGERIRLVDDFVSVF